jgi:hypothetical protein
MQNWKQLLKKVSRKNYPYRKLVGVLLIVIGFLALITPFTPGSWLMLVGLVLVGIPIPFWKNFKSKFLK